MKRALIARLLLALALALPSAGCGGGGDDTVPSVSGVFPQEVFLGRTTEVLISGSGTNWVEGVEVDFGAGVTVDDVVVSSPSALYVTLTVEPGAEVGGRDVTVTDSEASATLTGAFRVDTPLELDAVDGTQAQGSIVFVTLKNKDVLNPFDTTSTGGLLEPPSFPNITIATPAGFDAQVSNVSLYALTFTLLVDVTAEAGPVDVEVLSGPGEDTQRFILPSAVEIQQRDATAVSFGTPESADLGKPFDSLLLSASPSELSIMELAVSGGGAEAAPGMLLLGPSGSFGELIYQSTVSPLQSVRLAGDGMFYVIVQDLSGAAGYQATLDATAISASSTAHAEPNDDDTEAQAVAAPAVLQSGELGGGADEDWIAVTVEAGDVGKTLTAFTDGGHPLTDTVVDILFEDTETPVASSGDQDFHETASFVTQEAGTYWVRVSGSPEFFNPAINTYEAAVYLAD